MLDKIVIAACVIYVALSACAPAGCALTDAPKGVAFPGIRLGIASS
jgi:hypothetical protein